MTWKITTKNDKLETTGVHEANTQAITGVSKDNTLEISGADNNETDNNTPENRVEIESIQYNSGRSEEQSKMTISP